MMKRPILTIFIGIFFLSSCYSWESSTTMRLKPVPETPEPTTMRLTRCDDSRVVLHDATILGDSVLGSVRRDGRRAESQIETLTDVCRVEHRTFNTSKTILAVTGTVFLVAMIAGMVAVANSMQTLSW